mgnify:FL=1
MKDYRDVIDKMNYLVNDYHRMTDLDGHTLSMILKDLSSALYYLETIRAEVHAKWQGKVKELIDEGSSVARSENQAHVAYPEMYELRRIMDAGYEIVGAIRTNISHLKHEQRLEL